MDMIMIEGTVRNGWTLDLRMGSSYRQTSYVRTPAELEAAILAMVRLVHGEHEVTALGDTQRSFLRADGTTRHEPWGERETSSGT